MTGGQRLEPIPPGSQIEMTSKTEKADAVVNKNGQAKRNKNTDEYGNRYDCRSGCWGKYDEAVIAAKEKVLAWLDEEHCRKELELLNTGKFGRPFKYPPSLILFLHMQKEDLQQSYRNLIAIAR